MHDSEPRMSYSKYTYVDRQSLKYSSYVTLQKQLDHLIIFHTHTENIESKIYTLKKYTSC